MIPTPLLDTLDLPSALPSLSLADLTALAAEIRALMIETVSHNGGHLASGLGVVELTLALHRVFDFSRDALILDVGHQCYAHKIITGRRQKFSTLRQMNGISGFPNREESPFDWFTSGHAAASIAQAAGIAAAEKIHAENSAALSKNQTSSTPALAPYSSRQAVALIGDGSISCGLAFEAVNHLGHSGLDLLVVLNDNEMAISRTVGAVAKMLEKIRSQPRFSRWRHRIKRVLENVPLVGDSLVWLQERMLNLLKRQRGAAALFAAIGFRYFGPFDGHDLPALISTLENLRSLPGPRLLHVITEKGRGFSAAAADPESFHSPAPFSPSLTAKITVSPTTATYTEIFGNTLAELGEENPRVVAITAAMSSGTGMRRFAEKFPHRFFDVGIAESYAVAMAAGLARGGMIPIVGIYSTFLQRAYDQIFHDVLLQKNLPVIFAIDRAGLVGNDGPTHHGAFDISYLRHLPGSVLLAPRDGDELAAMLRWAVAERKTCAIRYPRAVVPERGVFPTFAPLQFGCGECLRGSSSSRNGAIIAYGRLVAPAFLAAQKLAAENFDFAVYNARFAKPLDEKMLFAAAQTGRIWTPEDSALIGGFGSAVAEFIADNHLSCQLTRLGLPDFFIGGAAMSQLDHQLGFDVDGIMRSLRQEQKKNYLPAGRQANDE